MLKKVIIFIPSIERGGVERNAIWVANELIERGISVAVVYVRSASDQLAKLNKEVELIKAEGKSWRFPHQRIWDAVNIRSKFNQYLKEQDPKSTIVITFQSGITAINICKKNNIKVISRLSNHPNIVKFESNIVSHLSEMLKPIYFKKADLVIANSEQTALDFSKKIHKPVKTIYNPIDLFKVEKVSTEPIEQELELEAQKYSDKLLVAVGRLAHQKDYITMIKGIAKSRYRDEIKVWILGEGAQRSQIEEAIRENGLEKTVRLLGYKGNVYSYMKKASLYIQTSLYEGCPNALIEAVAVGLPSISTNCLSGPEEVLLKGKGGILIPIQDYDAVGKAIDDFFEHPDLYRQKQLEAYKALDRFKNERIMEQYLDAMEQILQTNSI